MLVKMLINQTPIAYIIMDDNNRIHFVNESFLKLRELTDEEYNLIKSHPVKACEILDGLMDLDDIM